LRRLKGHPKGVFCLAFSPCGKVLASGGERDSTVLLWEVATGWQLRRHQAQEGGIRGLAFSPNGKVLVCGGADRTLRLWEVAWGRCPSEFSPRALSDHGGFDFLFIRTEIPRESSSREPPPPLVASMLFFLDGKTLATAGVNEGGQSGSGNRRRVI